MSEGITLSFVSLVKIGKTNVKKALNDSLELIGYRILKDIKNVVIKPNMCYYWDYTTGQTTDPKFVGALVDLVRDKVSPKVNISIVESDASAMRCKQAFKILGYEKMAKHHNAILVNLTKDKSDRVEVTAGGHSFSFMIPRTIKNADLRIGVPKIKYLAHTKVSCSLKNTFGCNPYPKKFKYHPKLDEAIVALNKIMKFDLYILDGTIVSGIHPRKLDLVMSSQDPVALDAAAAKIAGVNPRSVRHIKMAHEEGIGNIAFIAKGISIDYFARKYPRMNYKYKIMSLGYKLTVKLGLDKRLSLSD